jgi:hypothetical protein
MEDYILNKFLINNIYMLLLFVFLLGIFHIPFFFGKNFTKIGWKYIEYIWLVSAAFGIFSISNDVLIKTALNWSTDERFRVQLRYKEFEDFLNMDYFCNPAIKNENSPSNFESIEDDRKLICIWFKNGKELFEKLNFSDNLNYQKIDENYFKDFPNIKTTTYNENKKYFNMYLKEYNKQVEIYQRTIEYTKSLEFEKILFYLSPYFLIFGMALRIVKVTGEIIIEKKSEKEKINLG